VDLQPVDPNERFRRRRARSVRRRRLARTALAAVLVALGVAVAAVLVTSRSPGRSRGTRAAAGEKRAAPAKHGAAAPRPLPYEIRGVHVTMSLASLPDGLDRYLAVPGLNTVELDVKDESGRVGFVSRAPALARATGAAGRYYDPVRVAHDVHARGVYLIGRVVTFEDPVVAERRPAMAIRTRAGGVWHNRGGLGWANPYSRRYWRYAVDVGAAAARAGFDEIQFDYVRFPTDGDTSHAVFPGRVREPQAVTISRFLRYARSRLRPIGVRVSADVFGLAATRDLGIGQAPRRLARYVDALYPMVYPSHFNPGEYRLDDPNAAPGKTVAAALRDFNRSLRGRKALLVPWLQDFSLGRTYGVAEVRQQIDAARRAGAAGFMLWNAEGVYTLDVLDGP
jgi:hypothetical protein